MIFQYVFFRASIMPMRRMSPFVTGVICFIYPFKGDFGYMFCWIRNLAENLIEQSYQQILSEVESKNPLCSPSFGNLYHSPLNILLRFPSHTFNIKLA